MSWLTSKPSVSGHSKQQEVQSYVPVTIRIYYGVICTMPVGRDACFAARLRSEGRVVVVRGAHDVTLVLQELQHLLQHSLAQVPAEVEVHAVEDVQQVAALLHIYGQGQTLSVMETASPSSIPLQASEARSCQDPR